MLDKKVLECLKLSFSYINCVQLHVVNKFIKLKCNC